MSLRFNSFPFFEAPTATPAGGGKGIEDTIKFLSEDGPPSEKEVIDLNPPKDDKEEKAKDNKDDEETEVDETDDLTALEEELEEPDDEKLELTTPVSRREILKKYPNVFKDFPYLEKAYYREQQYTELLPTIDDAKEAVESAKVLQNIDADLRDGNIERILMAAKGDNQAAFNKIVNNYMETLQRVDKEAFNHVLGTTIKHTIRAMVAESRESKNDTLETAAQILHQFIFGSSKWSEPGKLPEDSPKKDTAVDSEREALRNERFNEAQSGLNTKVNNVIKSTIEQHIDPNESMTPFVKNAAIRQALEQVSELISKDSRLKLIVDRLWENAAKDNFSKESQDKIRSAFISKARTLLPTVIKSARNEALRGIGKRVRNDSSEREDKEESTPRRRASAAPPTRERTTSNKKPAGMSDLEFMMSDD